jgi:catechol O-methyltransferase
MQRNPVFAAIVMAMVDLAGLSDIVKVEVGPSSTSLRRLHGNGSLKKIDLLFLDHHKLLYVSDLKLCESLGLITPGSALAADNVIRPGAPEYLEYVRASVEQRREWQKPGHEQPTKDYESHGSFFGPKPDDKPEKGNADLIYESKILMADHGRVSAPLMKKANILGRD